MWDAVCPLGTALCLPAAVTPGTQPSFSPIRVWARWCTWPSHLIPVANCSCELQWKPRSPASPRWVSNQDWFWKACHSAARCKTTTACFYAHVMLVTAFSHQNRWHKASPSDLRPPENSTRSAETKRLCPLVAAFGCLGRFHTQDIALVERKNLRQRRKRVSSPSSTRLTNMHKLKGFPYRNLPRGWTGPAPKAYSVHPAAIQRYAGLNGGSGTSHRPKSSLSVCWCCKERLLLQLCMLTAYLLSTLGFPPPFRAPGSAPCKFPKANNDPHCFLLQAFKLWAMYTKAIWIFY